MIFNEKSRFEGIFKNGDFALGFPALFEKCLFFLRETTLFGSAASAARPLQYPFKKARYRRSLIYFKAGMGNGIYA